MKPCIKCGETMPLSEFYKHPQMKDGHINKCKTCAKLDTRKHRSDNIEKVREYDRARGNRQSHEYLRKYREKYPAKYKAVNMVNNAIRGKRLFREPCEACGKKQAHAHHDDYAKPLNVRWLCAAHHKQWHTENGEAKNAR